MTRIEILLPDQLVEEAKQAGLLSSASLEELLREKLRSGKLAELFSAMNDMSGAPEPATMTPEETAQEIAAMRAERRAAG